MVSCVWYVSKYSVLPTWGRVGTRGFEIMREIVGLGTQVVMITSASNHLVSTPPLQEAYRTEVVDGVIVRSLRTMAYRGAKSAGRILSWLDFEWRLWRTPLSDLPRPDTVIISSLSLLTIFNGLRLRRKYGCRLIFEVRDIWPLTLIEGAGFSAANPAVMALRWVEKLAYRRADAIVGTMPNLKQHVAESIGPNHPPVYCVPMGIDRALLEPSEPLPEGWAEAHIPDGKFVVCHAGAIGTDNALDVLIACVRAMKDDPKVHFLVVGDGDLRAVFQAQCADLPNITFADPVKKTQVQTVLGLCDLTYFSVHPNRVWNYGLSLNKVIDYMLSGKPNLASYSGYPTMVEEAGSGVSVPAGDPIALQAEIQRMAALPQSEREVMGQRGRDWVLKNRRYDSLAKDYLAIAAGDVTSA